MEWTRDRTIGRGSSATVYLGRQSGEIFAVKSVELLKSEFLKREQRILSMIKCPRIVGYLGCDVTNENGRLMYNLFMEYVSGGTLTEAIRDQGGWLEESAIRAYTLEILQGLDYLHSRGIVHCDVKGRNVLVGSDGAKVADLGCARLVDERIPAMPISGTPVFMAPEVARGDEQSFPADVWALGCTVIEMATGRPPWPDVADPVSALHRIAFSSDVPDFPGLLSEEAKDFLSKCLRRNPKERWTADQLLKHPFLDEGSCVPVNSKQIQGSTSSISPTSILDQGIWDSLGESDTDKQLVLGSSNSPAERIRWLIGGISSSSATPKLPDWTWNGKWVTIRSNNHDDSMEILPRNESAETSGSAYTAWMSDEGELELQRLARNEHPMNYAINSNSNLRSFSLACKDVNVVAISCNPHLEDARAKEILVSSISIPL
ncbi:hypothetical protein NE237_032047 [Protea cynaroides]|uniref:Protein kinase domain-containing protein n=1 Tax=Protea cynaroides TaxID=273540 RepID=A0A9Q0R364_9MAGN|nr:hypothetical protein NE237_032047 [Protea cynaroides]